MARGCLHWGFRGRIGITLVTLAWNPVTDKPFPGDQESFVSEFANVEFSGPRVVSEVHRHFGCI